MKNFEESKMSLLEELDHYEERLQEELIYATETYNKRSKRTKTLIAVFSVAASLLSANLILLFYFDVYFRNYRHFDGPFPFMYSENNPLLNSDFYWVYFILDLIAIGVIIYLYLKLREIRYESFSFVKNKINSLKNKRKRIEQLSSETTYRTSEYSNSTSPNNINEDSNKLSETSLVVSNILSDTLEESDVSKRRLEKEIYNLYSRGNINLIIGSVTTMFGIVTLFYSIFNTLRVTNFTEIVIYFVPRLSMILFIEVFAFFFLRLYRNSLADIKYYHNELTTIELKLLALKSATFTKDIDIQRVVIQEIVKTERNILIKENEGSMISTLNKLENERDKKVFDSIKELSESFAKIIEKIK